MHRFFITVLRGGIATAILFGLFGQLVVIPTTAADEVDGFPSYAPYAVPYTVVAIAGVACVQVVLAAAWKLHTMVELEAIFSPAAFRWVDTVIGACLVMLIVIMRGLLRKANDMKSELAVVV
ncbi:DUF2975 domain-containing protein [Streptomyces sp. NPDC060020]|uniref:DUF2975 domain-containing protein n=1 Tax=Streptomyces sp. NPDC060020 TaxID=3347038 RepID=UPI0036CD6593